jgi:hypothetical protein
MRLLICGDRDWNSFPTILAKVASLNPDVVIQGLCKGADCMGKGAARQLGIPCLDFRADWNKYGKAAGPIRNQEQIDVGKPTHCLAFHANIDISKGTKDMINRCIKAGIPTRLVYNYEGNWMDINNLL